jgi:hypothetical protein
MYRGF